MKWCIFLPVLNEGKMIESKILHSLDIVEEYGGHVVVVEGSVPYATEVNEQGLSSDGTSEVLKNYEDKITYLPVGKQANKGDLQNHAIKYIHQNCRDSEILHRTDADEFLSMRDIEDIDDHFNETNDWFLYTNLRQLISPTKGVSDSPSPKGPSFNFNRNTRLRPGDFHERFYRYRPDLAYRVSPHALSDGLGRMLFNHPDYFFSRSVIPEMYIYHYLYTGGVIDMLKHRMWYAARDNPNIEPLSIAAFDQGVKWIKDMVNQETVEIDKLYHCVRVRESKWFKYEDINYDVDKLKYHEVIRQL